MVHYFAPPPRKSPPTFPDASLDELKSFNFFIKITASELGGSFTADQWSAVARVACSQSATKHAIAALGALHEHFKQSGFTRDSTPCFALRQYGKAIHKLVGVDLKQSADNVILVLISCVLFAAFENLQGHYKSALAHTTSGAQILTENLDTLDASRDPSIQSCKELLHLSFSRFDTQAAEMTGAATVLVARRLSTSLRDIPEVFTSVEEAYVSLELFNNYFIHLTLHSEWIIDRNVCEEQTTRQKEHDQLDNYFRAWCAAFHKANFSKSTSAVRILRAHEILIFLLRFADHDKGETGWDAFLLQFHELITLGEVFLREQGYSSTFSMTLGMIAPLYYAAHLCRDPALRRRAVCALSSCKRREGVWDSSLAANVCQRIIEIEEGALDFTVTEASQIPEWARITYLEFCVGPDRSAILGFRMSAVESPTRDSSGGSFGTSVGDVIYEKVEW